MLKKRMKEMDYQSVDAQQQNGGNMWKRLPSWRRKGKGIRAITKRIHPGEPTVTTCRVLGEGTRIYCFDNIYWIYHIK